MDSGAWCHERGCRSTHSGIDRLGHFRPLAHGKNNSLRFVDDIFSGEDSISGRYAV
jgi:hypothetical protein